MISLFPTPWPVLVARAFRSFRAAAMGVRPPGGRPMLDPQLIPDREAVQLVARHHGRTPGHDRDGSAGGHTVETGLVIASTDALAADIVGARLLGFRAPLTYGTIHEASNK